MVARWSFGRSPWWVAALVALAATPAAAKPAHLKSLEEHYGPFLNGRLQNCSTCHLPSATGKAPTSLADFPHNLFGTQLRLAGEKLQAEGKRPDLSARLRLIAAQDADGDRAPNQVELLAGRAPGDAKERPTAAETAAVARKQPQFARFLAQYRWRPFEPVKRPASPAVKDARWAANPVDRFLEAERSKRGLVPQKPAERLVLLRRVYVDLIGLSPTPEEQAAFLADRSPDAYEKVVDRLLASSRYGERWGRHWMDVWRYSDWAGWGAQVRDSQPHIWRWRDWIIDSLNADKPYDRMVHEMLAGDELAPDDPKVLPATGYLVRNFKLLSREKWMQDTVDHTGQAFLGLTVGCARCHDHMYDPVTQNEYYRLRAIFEPHQVRTDWVPGQLDKSKDGLPRAYDAKPDAPTYFFIRGDERYPVKDQVLQPGVPAVLGGSLQVQPVAMPALARFPEKQPHVIADLRRDAEERVAVTKRLAARAKPEDAELLNRRFEAAVAGQAALEAVLRVEALEDLGKKDSPEWTTAAQETLQRQREQALAEARVKKLEADLAVAASAGKAEESKKAGDALKAAEKALADADAALKQPVTAAYKPRVTSAYPTASTGRRLAFARWLTSRENPLAARVAVNHIWLRHFGHALAPNPADLGRSGPKPTHPQLLDWLAAELMESGWKMKPLHRLIVTSATYRMGSQPVAASLAKDPDNQFLWRMSSRRMDAEVVRDNVLWVAGQLDTAMGGPDIDQNLGLSVKRRTVYFRHAAEKEMVFTNLFDGPNVVECYARKETVVPQQALAMANSELSLEQSRVLARVIGEKAGADPGRFVTEAFRRILARPPTAAEVKECLAFLQEASRPRVAVSPVSTAQKPAVDPVQRARENLALVLLNHNDFVTVR